MGIVCGRWALLSVIMLEKYGTFRFHQNCCCGLSFLKIDEARNEECCGVEPS